MNDNLDTYRLFFFAGCSLTDKKEREEIIIR